MTPIETTIDSERDLRIEPVTIDRLYKIWKAGDDRSEWNCLFTMPVWLDAWLDSCGGDGTAQILAVRHKADLLGIAPLKFNRARASLIGSADLCDYLDFIVDKNHPPRFYNALLSHLNGNEIERLDLGPLREDSSAFRDLTPIARKLGWRVHAEEDEVSFEMNLPGTWEDYLAGLKSKQRHEVRRKLRRLSESADFRLRLVDTPDRISRHFDSFLDLFRQSRVDKNDFLNQRRLGFFRRLTAKMAAAGMLRLYFLDIDDRPAAGALCFEHADTLYLYNSGYNRQFAPLSAGQVCTFLTIQAGIAKGLRCYNFLKGNEVYKKRLGGEPVQLVRLILTKA